MRSKKPHREIQSQFNRYIWLIETINREQKITFHEISKRWSKSALNDSGVDLPRRTFNNHRKAIEELFGITIACDKKDGNIYFIKNPEEFEKNGFKSWLINAFSVSNILYENRDLKDRIIVENIPSGEQFLTSILEAMNSGICLEISYQSYWREKMSVFEIKPYCVKLFSQRWYLLGYSDKLRIYSLDRIKSVDLTKNKFVFPINFDAKAYFLYSYGILNDGKAERVLIKAFKDNNRDKYIMSLPLHHSQQIVDQNDDYTLFSYYIQPTYDFRQELLSYGDEIEVLAPDWFRAEFVSIVNSLVDNYL